MKHLKKILLLGVFLSLSAGCSDNPASSNTDEKPIFPDFEKFQMDVSYFLQRPPAKLDGYDAMNDNAYSEAYTYAINAANLLNIYGASGFAYFGLADMVAPKFSDNMWNWTYSYQSPGVFTEMKLTSKQGNGGYDWNLYMTLDVEGGESYHNLRIMQGFTNEDGSSGRWSLFPSYQGSSLPIMEFSWNFKNETDMESTMKIFSEGSNSQIPIFEVKYKSDHPDYTISYINRESLWEKEIYWNTSTQTGFIIDESQKYCWNQSLETVDCN